MAESRLLAFFNSGKITGKMEVDIFHGYHLRIAAAGSPALHTKTGPSEAPEAQPWLFTNEVQPIGQPDGHSCFTLPAGVGVMAETNTGLCLLMASSLISFKKQFGFMLT